jgi:amidase
MDDLWRQGAAALAGMIARGEVSSAEVVAAHLDRIDAVNPSLNAVTEVLADSARDAAAAADRAHAGDHTLGPLHGVPFTVKQNIDLVGCSTNWGLAGAGRRRAAGRLAGRRADEAGRRDPDRPDELPGHGAARAHRLLVVRVDAQPVGSRPHDRWILRW